MILGFNGAGLNLKECSLLGCFDVLGIDFQLLISGQLQTKDMSFVVAYLCEFDYVLCV